MQQLSRSLHGARRIKGPYRVGTSSAGRCMRLVDAPLLAHAAPRRRLASLRSPGRRRRRRTRATPPSRESRRSGTRRGAFHQLRGWSHLCTSYVLFRTVQNRGFFRKEAEYSARIFAVVTAKIDFVSVNTVIVEI